MYVGKAMNKYDNYNKITNIIDNIEYYRKGMTKHTQNMLVIPFFYVYRNKIIGLKEKEKWKHLLVH